MQPVKLTIHGDFWDSHIYRGRLYVWDTSNALHIFDWTRFIAYLADSVGQPILESALARGDSLYRDLFSGSLARDPDVLSLVKHKIGRLSELELSFEVADLEGFLLSTQDSPFGVLHDDLVIFKNTLYALTERGFFSSQIHTPKRSRYRARPAKKIWCGRGVSLSASKAGLAIAAASDGLFEYVTWLNQEPESVSGSYASFASWLFASIYASSPSGGGYLAGYKWVQDPSAGGWKRELGGILSEEQVFETPDPEGGLLTWGSQEKLYQAGTESITVVRFTQKYLWERDSQHSPFEKIGELPIRNGSAPRVKPISAGVSFFGSVVEYPDGIYVVQSDRTILHIPGAATRWRVFPRSRWYPNHLHVLLEDRLEIFSINGDLFSDQRQKLSGIEFQERMLAEL